MGMCGFCVLQHYRLRISKSPMNLTHLPILVLPLYVCSKVIQIMVWHYFRQLGVQSVWVHVLGRDVQRDCTGGCVTQLSHRSETIYQAEGIAP